MGILAAVIFILILLSFTNQPNNDNKEPNSNHIKTWQFLPQDTSANTKSYFLQIPLEKTMVSKFDLGIVYKVIENNASIPISAYSSQSGFVNGIIWKPTSIIVNKTVNANKLQYQLAGIVNGDCLVLLYMLSLRFIMG